MERLILELNIGDGYTFTSTASYPIVYESKEKALHDLELILIDKSLAFPKLIEKRDASFSALKKAPSNQLELYREKYNECCKIEEEIKEYRIISFGGQKFSFSDFVSIDDDDKSTYEVPRIETLDEFFAHVEKRLDKPKTNKL